MPNYEREAKIALGIGIVFAVAFGAGIDEFLREADHSLTKTGTTIVFGLVGLMNFYQVLSTIKKLAAAARTGGGGLAPSDEASEPTVP